MIEIVKSLFTCTLCIIDKKNVQFLQHMSYLKNESARKSYWARNFVGWPKWSSAPPNTAHVTLAKWERARMLQHLITQNVDQLHFKVNDVN